ncbi:F510_1955 family glycosylhydrolase [Candidatus Blastococcus massiliensis]|uniref:F510_1955 family glycosylhydrolase n=1 Tax=Candidatus Blastococcus massiliensis TaxID=1470358 RepID=UPI0004B196DC|nr:exo-alpha-sialidase [Candidatus Blastococcus massiliensis]
MTLNPFALRGPGRRRSLRTVVLGVAAAIVMAGCTASGADEQATPAVPAGSLPSAHIHGVGVDPADGTTVLATHDGLFRVSDRAESTRVGPAIDLMGFAVAGPGHFLASGHPGIGVDMAQPVGLIESTDGGQTWTALSREGESDFHALAVSSAGVLGFDGALRRSSDHRRWQDLAIPAEPAALAASPDGQIVLAATEQGLLRSTDSGTSWSPVEGASWLAVLSWAESGTVGGIDSAGRFWASTDGGVTWEERAHLDAAPQAVHLRVDDAGAVHVLAVTDTALVESVDGGYAFHPVLSN